MNAVRVRNPLSIFSLYFTYFSDFIGWAIVTTFTASFVFNATEYSLATKNIILGALLITYPVTQWFGSPILGELSDIYGRKKIFVLTLMGSCIGFFLSIVAITHASLALLFISRLLIGFTSGNQALSIAAIIDSSARNQRGKRMAILSVAGGLAWMCGPFIGTMFSNEEYSFAAPYRFAAFLFFIALLLVMIFYKDTYERKYYRAGNVVRDFCRLFEAPLMGRFFGVFFLNLFGWYIFIVFLSAFLIQKFSYNERMLGEFTSFFAMFYTIGGLLGSAYLLRKYLATKIAFIPQIILGIGILVFAFSSENAIWWIIILPAIAEALIYPCFLTILSNLTLKRDQGKLFGIVEASNATCQILGTVIMSLVAGWGIELPMLGSAVIILLGGILFSILRKKLPN